MEVEICKGSTVVYESWMKLADSAGGRQMQDKIIMALLRYAFYGESPDFEYGSKEYILFMSAVQLVAADKRKKNGGAPKGNKNASKNNLPKQPTKTTTKNNPKKQPENNPKTNNDNDNINDNVNVMSADTAPPPGADRQTEVCGLEGLEDRMKKFR